MQELLIVGPRTRPIPAGDVCPPMVNKFVSMFLRGLAVVLPIAASGWLLWNGLILVDGWFQATGEHSWRFPGLGLLTILALASVVGLFAEVPPTKDLIDALEELILRIPLVKHVYGTIKDFFDAFLSKHKRFDKPVLVRMGGGLDAEVIGFVTSDDLAAFGLLERVAVYLPQSYNIGGNLLILPRSRLTPIEADSASVMTFIVSGGVTRMAESGSSNREVRGYSRRLQRAMRLRYTRRSLI